MAIMKGTKNAYTDEINTGGITTQLELDEHEGKFAHAPNAIIEEHNGKYLRFVNGNYIWDDCKDIEQSQTNIGTISDFTSSLN